MFEKYCLERGEPPAQDVVPTGEQLGAVKQFVDATAPPYVDISLFGPHGRRLRKKLNYTEFSFNPSTGDWTKGGKLQGAPASTARLRLWTEDRNGHSLSLQ